MNKKIFNYLRVFVSLFLLGLLFYLMRDKMDNLLQVIRNVDILKFFLTILFIIPLLLVSSLRLRCFLLVQGLKFKLSEIMRFCLIGYFFNNFMPSTVGGDVAKIYYIKKHSDDYTRPFSAVFVDRIVGLSSLVVMASIAVIFWGRLIHNPAAKFVILLSFLMLVLFMGLIYTGQGKNRFSWLMKFNWLNKLKQKLIKVYNAISLYRKSKSLIFGFMLSFSSHALLSVYAFTVAKTLNIDLPIYIFFILIPVVALISSLPSLNGLGIREGAFVYFFKEFISPEQALALSILYFGQMIILSAIGGLVYLLNGAKNIKEVSYAK